MTRDERWDVVGVPFITSGPPNPVTCSARMDPGRGYARGPTVQVGPLSAPRCPAVPVAGRWTDIVTDPPA